MEEFHRKVEEFFSELGISGKKTISFLESGKKDFRAFITQKGGRILNYQKDLRNTVKHRGLILPRAVLVITSIAPDGEIVALGQKSDNDLVLFPTEDTIEWLYYSKTAVESPKLAAYLRLFKIIGNDIKVYLEYVGERTTTKIKENKDIIYDMSMFYKTEIPFDMLKATEKRGNWKVYSISDFESVP